MITYILLALLGLTLAIGIVTLRNAINRQTEALGRAYGNVNDLSEKIDREAERLQNRHNTLASMLTTIDGRIDENAIMVRDTVKERLDVRLDEVALRASMNKDAIQKDLLEMTTAITKAFMEETIEIKQGIEILVEGLAEPVGVHMPLPPITPCQVKGCKAEGTVEVPIRGQRVSVCEQHAQVLAKEVMSQPAKRRTNVCEDGHDHSDDPDYIPGQIHAHVDIPDSAPDMGTMKPEPLDPISAAIEAAYKAKKPEIDAALDKQ